MFYVICKCLLFAEEYLQKHTIFSSFFRILFQEFKQKMQGIATFHTDRWHFIEKPIIQFETLRLFSFRLNWLNKSQTILSERIQFKFFAKQTIFFFVS